MATALDCVVIGYHDQNFDGLLERNEPFREISGGYRHLLANSALFQGRRLKYFDLLNLALNADGDGPRRSLHVAKMPNLAVCYLVSYLRRRGLHTEYINFFDDEQDHLRALLQESPRAVAITTTFYFEPEPIREIVDVIREQSPDTRIIVGGPFVFNTCSDAPIEHQDEIFEQAGADIYVFDSQGEDTLSQLCQAGRHAFADLDRIPNLVIRDGAGTFRRTPRVIEQNDLNANAIDWSLFDPGFLAPTVQTRTARSCAYSCAFCRYPVMAGALTLMSLETIERELDYLDRIGTRCVLFIDDTFNVPVTRFKDICRLMIRKRYGFSWFSYFRCANADDECFDLMSEAGCAGVFLGIESGDDRVLKQMNKVASVAKYERGIRELKKRDIITYSSFIVGYPSETEESAHNTLAFIRATQPTYYSLETFFYDPKVPVASRAEQFALSGSGYAWRHATMDWQRASEIVESGYRTMTESIMLPLYGFDLWSVAYLLGEGLSRAQIADFLRLASKLTVSGLDSGGAVSHDDEVRLMQMFRAPAESSRA